ncbi:MAG: hypothetical protein QXS37_02970 [Candidatus Aenigmatarchaeota archaeon]
MRVLYITHCSKKKNNIRSKTLAENLYSATYLQRFIKKCKELDVKWGILSDKYGIVFPKQKIKWYDLSPSHLLKNQTESKKLIKKVTRQLQRFNKIFFYYNPGRFHPFYRYLIRKLRNQNINIKLISHLSQISIKEENYEKV